jgi:hypothetical protein
MLITSSGQLQLYRQTGLSSTANTVTTADPLGIVNDGQMHTISYVYDGSNIIGQLDNETVVVGQNANQQQTLAFPITVGADPTTVPGISSNYMNGILYSLKIYSSATASSNTLVGSFTFDSNSTTVSNAVSGRSDVLTFV